MYSCKTLGSLKCIYLFGLSVNLAKCILSLKNCMFTFTYFVCLHVFVKGVDGWMCAYLVRG